MLFIPLLIFLTFCPAMLFPMGSNDAEASKALQEPVNADLEQKSKEVKEALAHYSKIMAIQTLSKQASESEKISLLNAALFEMFHLRLSMFCTFTDNELCILADYFINNAQNLVEHTGLMNHAGHAAYLALWAVISSVTPKTTTLIDSLRIRIRTLLALPNSTENAQNTYRELAKNLHMNEDETRKAVKPSKRTHEGLLVHEQKASTTCEPEDSSSLPTSATDLEHSWNADVAKLHAIEKAFHEKKSRQHVKYSDCQAAASAFSRIKESLRLQLLNSWAQTEDFFKRTCYIDRICTIVHPLPLSEQRLKSEEALLDMALKFCTEQLTNPAHHAKAKEYCVLLRNQKAQVLLNYNNLEALFHSESIEILLNVAPSITSDEAKTAHLNEWNKLAQAIRKNIENYKVLEKAYGILNNSEAVDICEEAIARGYERLGNCHHHSASLLARESRVAQLKEALDYHTQALSMYKKEKSIVRLQIHKLHVLDQIQKEFTKLGAVEESQAREKEIAQILESFDLYKVALDNPVIIFFHLSNLAERYKRTKDTTVRERALKDIRQFHTHSIQPRHSLVQAWLKYFSVVFDADKDTQNLCANLGFKMTPLSEADWQMKRKEQLLQGLLKLMEYDFAQEYNIDLKQHQKDAFFVCYGRIIFGCTSGYFCLPRGAKKNVTALLVSLASEMPTLIIVPTPAIMEQIIAEINYVSPNTPAVRFDGNVKDIFNGYFMVTTYANLERDAQRPQPRLPLDQFGIIWADDAHHSLTPFRASLVQKARNTAFVFGLIPTDTYENQRKGSAKISEVFGERIFEISLLELIRRGELAPVRNIIIHAPELLKSGRPLSEYTDAELESALNQPNLNDIISDIYFNEYDPTTCERLLGQSALIFCSGAAHAEVVCKLFNEKSKAFWKKEGPFAACVHTKIPLSKCNAIIKLHQVGEIPILVGDKFLEEQYDNPSDRIAFFVRPYAPDNGVNFQQNHSRLFRNYPGKNCALIFDFRYPSIDQLLTKDLFTGQAWVGVEQLPLIKPERKTTGYTIDWHPFSIPGLNMQSFVIPENTNTRHALAEIMLPEVDIQSSTFNLSEFTMPEQ